MDDFNDFEYGLYDDGEETIILTLADDTEVECSIVAIFPVDNKDYIAVLPLENQTASDLFDDEPSEVFLYRLKKDFDGKLF